MSVGGGGEEWEITEALGGGGGPIVCCGLKKLNSMVSVRERTIPTERPPLVGEVIANLCG
jgi:hypothetical protein